MAKKKANSAIETKSKAAPRKAATAVKTQAATNGKKLTAASRAPAVSAAGLSNEAIGDAAGKLWAALADGGSRSLSELKTSIDAPSDLVLAAVGWLAREDKLTYSTKGRSGVVSLR